MANLITDKGASEFMSQVGLVVLLIVVMVLIVVLLERSVTKS